MKTPKTSRKSFFQSIGLCLAEFIDEIAGEELESLQQKFPEIIRPPGVSTEEDFLTKCHRCGDCIKACPYSALYSVFNANSFDNGTPALRVGSSFCRFCQDFPCIAACKTSALSKNGRCDRIGLAKSLPTLCLRIDGNECEACATICNRTFAAITYSGTNSPPQIDADKCSGCGACLSVCPVLPVPALALRGG